MIKTKRIEEDGIVEWISEEGFLHREDGPAFETPRVSIYYYKGQPHREDGPALVYRDSSGRIEWWLWGEEFTFEDWLDCVELTDEQLVQLKLKYGK